MGSIRKWIESCKQTHEKGIASNRESECFGEVNSDYGVTATIMNLREYEVYTVLFTLLL